MYDLYCNLHNKWEFNGFQTADLYRFTDYLSTYARIYIYIYIYIYI
jgi:hypothetical protein